MDVWQEYNTTVSEASGPRIEIKNVDEGTSRAADLRQTDAALGTVINNYVLTAPGAPEKRHLGTSAGISHDQHTNPFSQSLSYRRA